MCRACVQHPPGLNPMNSYSDVIIAGLAPSGFTLGKHPSRPLHPGNRQHPRGTGPNSDYLPTKLHKETTP